MSEIEMQDLSRRSASNGRTHPSDEHSPCEDTTVSLWAWSAATLLLATSACLTISPRLLRFLAEANSQSGELTPLESFLALHFGILLSAVALALILNMPSSDPVAPKHQTTSHPLLLPVSVACSFSAFFAYNTRDVGTLATAVFLFSATIGVWGLWETMFAGSSLISKTTGADKRTSAFIFGNKNAASVQKRVWRERQRK